MVLYKHSREKTDFISEETNGVGNSGAGGCSLRSPQGPQDEMEKKKSYCRTRMAGGKCTEVYLGL